MDCLDDPLTRIARERFGLDYLYPYQRLVAANVLDAAMDGASGTAPESGRLRQIVLLPTGFGKSLCFQLPALLLPRPTLVVYPLLALMQDQRRRLEGLGIPCALFRGGMESDERRAAEASIEKGESRIIISNPECLRSPRLLDFLKETNLSHVAIDEAHCVSEWGESFRPAYLELGRLVEALEPPALSAFTATASPGIFSTVATILFGSSPYTLIEGDPDRPNISYAVVPTLSRDQSLTRLARELPRPLIVFCSSRESSQMLARLLSERLPGNEVRFYHAGLERPEKKATEEWFFSSDKGILCSTCAYGLGMDKKDIRSVIHFEAPPSVEAYLQEAGRAGRDGLPSRAILLAGPGEERRLEREKDKLRRSRFRALIDYEFSATGCRRDSLLDLLGSRREGRPPCSGCDRCEAGAAGAPRGGGLEGGPKGGAGNLGAREGEREILAFAVANSRRFSVDEALALLLGRSSGAGGGEPPRCALWGALAGWEARDAARAMAEALSLGLVREGRSWPWKGLLEAGGARAVQGSGDLASRAARRACQARVAHLTRTG